MAGIFTWVQRTGGYPAGNSAFTVAADTNGNAVAIPSNAIYRSTDGGITWTLRTDPSGAVAKSVAWGNGVFMAGCGGATNIGIRSTDGGSTWTAIAKPTGWTNNGTDAFVYHPGMNKWLAVQNDIPNGKIRYAISSDGGLTWAASALIAGTEEVLASGGTMLTVDPTNFVLTGRDNSNLNWIVAYTSDTANWTIVTGGSIFSNPGDQETIAYANGIYMGSARSALYLVESDTLAGWASNAGYSMSSLFTSGNTIYHVFTPDNGTTWLCSSNGSKVASTTKKPSSAGVWALETIAIPNQCYITCFCYDVKNGSIIAVGTGTTGIVFTAAFTAPGGGAAGGGGGGHGAKAGQKRPGFGFYVDQLQRQQLEKKHPSARKVNWVRHYD